MKKLYVTILSFLLVVLSWGSVAEAELLPGITVIDTQVIEGRNATKYQHTSHADWGYGASQTDYFWLVAPTNAAATNAPFQVVLHSAGHSGDSILVDAFTTRRVPQYYADGNYYVLYLDCKKNSATDWWWGYHGIEDNMATYQNKLYPTEERVLATVEWVMQQNSINRDRVYLGGVSMGGSGSLGIGLIQGDTFAAISVAVPAGVNHMNFRSPMMPQADPPVLVNISSQVDSWSEGQESLLYNFNNNRYSLVFGWGPFGHTVKSTNVGPGVIDFPWRSILRNEAYPVFTDATTDDIYPGYLNSTDLDQVGQINGYFRWQNITDVQDHFAMELWLFEESGTPTQSTVQLSFRRLQQFKPTTGQVCRWQLLVAGNPTQEGHLRVGDDGLISIPDVTISNVHATLDIVIEPPILPVELPFVESFESYLDGENVMIHGTSGWKGEFGGLVARAESYTQPALGYQLVTNHNVVAELTDDASYNIESATNANVWADFLLRPLRYEMPPYSDPSTNTQMDCYVNAGGYLVLYHRDYNGGNSETGSNVWSEIASPYIATNDWIRISVNMDYATFDSSSYYFQLKVNGTLATNAAAKVDGQGLHSYFPLATVADARKMKGFTLHGLGKFDDIVINTNVPTYSVYYIIASSIEAGAEGGGINPLSNTYIGTGSNSLFTVASSNHWSIERIAINDHGVLSTNNFPSSPFTKTFTNVTVSGSIWAAFVADVTDGVPHWWMAASITDFTNGLAGNPDGDTLTTRQEYFASTDPTNAMSTFKISRIWQTGGTNYVQWESHGIDSALPPFDILSTTNLNESFIPAGIVVREKTNTWSSAISNSNAFFRISVTNAP